MASRATGTGRKNKPWRARRKRGGVEYLIGYFETKEQAKEAERGFDEQWPNGVGWSKGLKRDPRTFRYYNPSTGLDY